LLKQNRDRLACTHGNCRGLFLSRRVTAQGIAAEIPQTSGTEVEELERKARFFAALCAAKNAPKFFLKFLISPPPSLIFPFPFSFDILRKYLYSRNL
jgi:hypothetical protein